MLGYTDLVWRADKLYRRDDDKVLLRLAPDATWPRMWRVERPDGSLTDMANLTWARDAGRAIALRQLNRPDSSTSG